MTAYFKKSADTYQSLFPVLRSDSVEVLIPKGQVNCARPGNPPKYIDAACYLQIDVTALRPLQRKSLEVYLSRKWKQPIHVIQGWLSDSRNGIPLIASDVVGVAESLFS